MKILFRLWKFPGVSETFILAQIATAIKAGFDVKILINDERKVTENNIHKNLIRKYKLEEKLIFEDLKIPKNKFYRMMKAILLLIQNIHLFPQIINYFKNKKNRNWNSIYQINFYKQFRNYDIIHIQYGTNAKPLDLLKKVGLIRAKLVVSFHGHDLFFPINGMIDNNGYYNVLFDCADRLVANTPYLYKLLLELGAPREKMLIIPVSVNSEFFSSGPNVKALIPKEINLISVGRLVKFKGHIKGIEAVRILTDRGYNVHYNIIGSGNQLEFLKRSITDYELTEKVKLLGKKSQKEIKELLISHDIFLMTSITDPDYGVETQGLVSAEAQACGLPVIAFDSGGVKYTIENGISGFVVKEGDVEQMADKIEKLINDVSLRKNMGKAAIHYIEKNFSQHIIDKIWIKEYSNILSKR